MPTYHTELYPASRLAGEALMRAKESAFLVDSDIGGTKTLATMETQVNAYSSPASHSENMPMRARINQGLDLGVGPSEFTTTNIQAQSTLKALAALTQADPTRTFGGPLPE